MPVASAQTSLSGPVVLASAALAMLCKAKSVHSRRLMQSMVTPPPPSTHSSTAHPSAAGQSHALLAPGQPTSRSPKWRTVETAAPVPARPTPCAPVSALPLMQSLNDSTTLLEIIPPSAQNFASSGPSSAVTHSSNAVLAEQLLDAVTEPGAPLDRRKVIDLIADLLHRVSHPHKSDPAHTTQTTTSTPQPVSMMQSLALQLSIPELRVALAREDSAMSAQCLPPQTTRTERAEVGAEIFDGTFTLNQYVLLQSIGHGAQGEVFLSVDTNKNEMRAVKAIPRPTRNRHCAEDKEGLAKDQPRSPLELARANRAAQHEREIEVMKRCRHRNIVSLYEVIDDPSSDKLYLVMQYIEHGSLVTLQPDGTASQVVKPELLAQYTRQLCAGLQYLHSHGIVHRDIKPDNILLGADDTVYLSDFGVSDVFEASAHVSPITGTRGTSAFLSPELVDPATTSAVDGRAVDVWALGVTVYVMLYGKLPFERKGSMFDFWRMVLEVDVALPPVDPANPAADAAWRTLLQAMLHKSPAKRCTAEQARVYAKAIEEAYNLGSPNFSGVHSFELFPPSAFELPLDLASIVVPPRNLMMPADDMSSARSSRDASFNSRTMLPQEKSASAHPMGSINSGLASAREHLHDEQTADSLATARPRSPCY